MDVSVIIINYRTAELVAACVKSIIKFTRDVSYEIIVVDNHSEDDCKDVLSEISKNIIFIELEDNLGFGVANNKGVEVSSGRNILCLNPDTILINNAIKELSFFLDSHGKVGVCGGNLYDEKMNPTHSFFRYLPSVFWEINVLFLGYMEKLFYYGNYDFNKKGTPFEVGYITGADLMVRRDVFKLAGGYSSDFFMYYEDTDLCFRIKRLGYKIYSVPTAAIQHLEGRSFDKERCMVNERRIRLMEKSRLIYYKRNVGRFERFVSNMIYDIALHVNIFVFKCLKRVFWKNYKYRQMAFHELRKQF